MENGIKKKANYYFRAYYKPDKNNEKNVKILDKQFIKFNKNKCKIEYKNKTTELKEYFEDIDKNYNHKDKIKIKIIVLYDVINMSSMFYDCDSLISLTDAKEENPNISYL